MGQEADDAGQPLAWRRCIAQAAPVDAFEAGRHVMSQLGGEARLANATYAKQPYQATALDQHPATQQLQLADAVHEA